MYTFWDRVREKTNLDMDNHLGLGICSKKIEKTEVFIALNELSKYSAESEPI